MKNRRKKHLVEKDFQLRIIITYALTCSVSVVLVPAIFYLLASKELDTLKWKMTFRADPVIEMIIPALLSESVIAALFLAATMFIVSWHFKSKTKKSVEKIMDDLNTIAEGNLSSVPKMNDVLFFRDASKEISFMVSRLNHRFKKSHENFSGLKHIIDSLPDIKEDLLPKKCTELKNRAQDLRNASDAK